jgi:hypothetical protein
MNQPLKEMAEGQINIYGHKLLTYKINLFKELHMYIPVANTINKKNITIKFNLDSLFVGQKDQ